MMKFFVFFKPQIASYSSILTCCRLPPRDVPRLIATLNEGDIDFTDLTSEQWVNHFEGVSQLTTKQGLCDLTRDLSVFQAHADEVVPRCYNLGDAMQRDEFIDDFRLTAAVIVLKFYFSQRLQNILIVGSAAAAASTSTSASTSATATMNSNKSTANNSKATSSTASSSVEMSSSVFQNAMYALQWQLRVKLYGEWPEVDISKHFKDKEIPLVDKEWWEITEKSYEYARIQRDDDFVLLAKLLGHIPTGLSAEVKAQLHRNFTPIDFKVMQMLKLYMQINPQFWMDGNRNIWIMKSPDSSCGIGMRISYRLEEILDIERGMGGRIVQKYTEIPLLAPMTRQMTMQVWKQIHKGGGSQMASMKWAKCKFDLRVWVVVTRLSPGLEAYIYPVVYGRRCSTVYHNDVQSLSEHYVHLTNYSLQKKATVNTSSSTSTAEDTQGSSKKNKLRKICKDARSQPSSFSLTQDLSNTGKTNEEELLIRT